MTESERLFRALTEKASELLAIADAAGAVTRESPSQTRLLGYATGELLGRNIFELLHADDRAKALAVFQEGIGQPGAIRQVEARVQTKQGAWRWFDIVGTNLLDDPAVQGVVLNCRDVTERKQMEEESIAAARRWQAAFDAVGDAVWIMDSESRIQSCNKAACELVGRKDGEVIGRHCWEIVHGSTGPIPNCPFRRMLESRHREEMELAWGERWYRVTADPVFDLSDNLAGAVHIIRDITESKVAEAALRESERRYQRLAEASPVGIFRTDVDGRTTYVNQRLCEIVGLDSAAALGDGWLQAVHPDDRSAIAQGWAKAARAGEASRVEYRFRRPDGTVVWVYGEAVPQRDDNGRLIGYIGTISNITKRKQAEEALRESEQRFRTLAEAIPQQICVMDSDSRPEYANRLRLDYTGITLEQAQTAGGWWEALHPDDRPMLAQVWNQSRKSGTLFECEYRLRRASDGQYRWFLGRGVPIKDQQGHVLKWFVTATDIDERKHLEELLEARVQQRTAELREEISRSQRLEQQILEVSEREQRRIGHDLHDSVGQRLTGAKFLSSSLSRRLARAKTPGASTATRISRELDVALEEIRGIVNGLAPVRPDGDSLMSALHQLAARTTKVFKIPCQLECPQPVLVHNHIAAIHLYRIAQEAVGNAVRHANAKHIHITLRQTDAGIELRILDDGSGVPSPSQRRTGMGLEIMKHRASVIGATFGISRAKTGGTIASCLWTPPSPSRGEACLAPTGTSRRTGHAS